MNLFPMADVFFKIGKNENEFQLRLPDTTPMEFKPQLPHIDYGPFMVNTQETSLRSKVLSFFLPHTRSCEIGTCKYLYPEVTNVEWLPESVCHWSVIQEEDYYKYLHKTAEFTTDQDNARILDMDETAFMNIHSVPARIAASPELLEAIAVEAKKYAYKSG